MSAIGASTTTPLTSHFQMRQPGPQGMTEKARMAEAVEMSGAAMYSLSLADIGKKLSLRMSFSRSAKGCSRPNLPARLGP